MGVPTLSDSAGYAEGKPAVGPTVRLDLEALQTELDGNIDRNNLKDGEVITAKIAAAAVDSTKLATNSVREDHAFFGETGAGMLVPRLGPSYNSEGNTNSCPRLVMVSKEVTWDGTTPDTVVFTYANDCVDGNPAFTAVPHLLGAPVVASVEAVGDVFTAYNVSASTAAAITIIFAHTSSSATVQIEFGVMGAMS